MKKIFFNVFIFYIPSLGVNEIFLVQFSCATSSSLGLSRKGRIILGICGPVVVILLLSLALGAWYATYSERVRLGEVNHGDTHMGEEMTTVKIIEPTDANYSC